MKYGSIHEGNPATDLKDECKLLNAIYTDLYIVKGGTGGVCNEHEVRQAETASRRLEEEEIPVKISDIFKNGPDQQNHIKKVLTLGIAGVGKTVSVHKFILDWAEGGSNQDIDFIFPIPFRNLNLMTKRDCSLMELLHRCFPDTACMKSLPLESRRIMFIFDGLDESRLPLKFSENEIVSDIMEETSVDLLITNLIKGEMLPSALIWITSRPAAVDQIPHEYIHQVTEVRGFTDIQKEEYFRKSISDQDQAESVISHIKKSRSLHILCHIPVFCWISATVLKKMLGEYDNGDIPKTLTEMYIRFLLFQSKMMEKKYKEAESGILKLAELAFHQLEKGNLLFYEEDLRECGIDVRQASVYSGFCTQIFKEEEEVFSFVHLSVQECLAAAHVFLSFHESKSNPLLHSSTEKLQWLLRHNMCDLHKTAVKRALQSKTGHLDLFLRFLLGLSLESNQRNLKKLLPHVKIRPESVKETVEYIKRKLNEDISSERSINLLYCLSELKDDSLLSEIQKLLSSGNFLLKKLSSAQWSALVFVLQMSEETQEKFELMKYRGSDEGLKRLLPVVKNTKRALLAGCNLTEQSCEAVASVLQSANCPLRELDLSNNDLQDSGVKQLFAGLEGPQFKLEVLRLAGCKISENSLETMVSALQSANCPLRELDLSNNDLQDSGVKLLSAGLESSHCKLEILRLAICKLTEQSCGVAVLALQSANCPLRELDLSNNDLQDSGVKLLFAGLEGPHCKLEILRLAGCKLTEQSCSSVASVLQSANCPLRELDLSNNDLHDSGVKLTFAGLENPHSKLEILKLAGCNLTERSCLSVASNLQSTNCALKELGLSYNDLQDSGVKLLFAGLKNPHCKLEILRLAGCKLTEQSCEAVASVLQSVNCPLRELDLSNNDLQDSGVKMLCVGLKNPQCKMEILRVAGCKLSEKSCETVASVLKSANCLLREVDLSNNDLHDSGVKLLSAGLENPHCKLEILKLSGCLVTEEGCSSLASALRSNPSHLRELDLSYNHPGDSGMKLLSAKLGEPNCELGMLNVEHGGELRMKPGLRKYACKLTLDPNTANRHLSLSEGNRKVACVTEQSYPDHPERFEELSVVLCRENLTGRCYWEIDINGCAAIGVTYKGIGRKGKGRDCRFGLNDKSWSLFCFDDRYSAWHNNHRTFICNPSLYSERVGVYLDWPAGTLSFYSVSSDTHTLTHIHTFHSTFTEPLYAGFRLWRMYFNDSSLTLWKTE
ncbi:NACHT, LRR and PYD domains-containing protein 12-like [Chanos chanos]|uniref:NACHT, LRR and PYD domains-containing protein 12-like n=1 Tax=Chanos chanos TaxID=29144 RepID=A0A6J2VVX9_CHACN|nr:NACHT, LRR and PYD domains-containing protein 12-like [Chanos chanos]